MQILQFDVNSIEYELVKPEAKVYEKVEEKKFVIEDALVLFVSIEKGDSEEIAKNAIGDASRFMTNLKREKLVIYPFAHLSRNLEAPDRALQILEAMKGEAKEKGLIVFSAPFGWNKKLKIDIKGHPMAEQSKRYGASAAKVDDAQPKHETTKIKQPVDMSIVRKSDWSGLPDTDHRTIGERLNLYSFQEVSPGMVYWHPKGHIMFRELLRFVRENQERYGYQEISTPAVANLALWHVSGHIDHYKDDMFIFESEKESLGMKPMNCPSSILIYKSRKWSYKELPFRTMIMDRLYRNEISGALTGLFRVREFTQDDSHIFIREDQIGEEITSVLKLMKETYATFGFEYKVKLSTMPDSHMGDDALWERATNALKNALDKNGIKYVIKDGEGAFYGPKIDVDIKDSQGREWQCATIQVDYQLPLRFGLEYIGEDGKAHSPVIIHRAILGTLERFMGILVEHYKGKFPLWLSPIQVRVITISEQSNDYAQQVYDYLKQMHIRAQLDISDKTLEYKIRDAKTMEINYTVVIGKKEQEAKTISVRDRSGKQSIGVKIEDFAISLEEEIRLRR